MLIMMHGEDEYLENGLRNIFLTSSLGNQITLIEDVLPHEEMIKLFLLSDISVSIAENDETCSAILESMYCGSIPLISDTPTYKDRFEAGRNVLFIRNKDLKNSPRCFII